MDEIAEQALDRVRLEQDYTLEVGAGKEISAARALGDELDRLEALAAELLTVRNRVRVKARALHTSRQVGDAQTSEAELVSAPLQRRIEDLEMELEQYRTHHHCTDGCTSNAHVAFTGKGLVKQLRQRIKELESQVPSEVVTMPAECLTVGRLNHQLDVALSQVSALQRRNDELGARVSDMSGWLDLKAGELASANEQRDQALAEVARLRAAWTTEVERGRDLEADLSRLREELARRYTLANVMDQRAEAREEANRENEQVLRDLKAELDRVGKLASVRLGEIDSLNTKLKISGDWRETHQRDKQAAWERLATIERIARQPEVDNELGEVAHRPEPGALAGAMVMIREALKGFS
jgi:chromosome segregation ATPase